MLSHRRGQYYRPRRQGEDVDRYSIANGQLLPDLIIHLAISAPEMMPFRFGADIDEYFVLAVGYNLALPNLPNLRKSEIEIIGKYKIHGMLGRFSRAIR
jgi:hypothetical protein